jgi:N utilization substance protein A
MAIPNLLNARTEFALALNQICAERGIAPELVLDTIEQAILAAYRKDFGLEEEEDYEVEVNPQTGAAKIFQGKGKKKKDITPPGFGRIAAQTAKQVILQKIREAEKDAILDEYQGKVAQLVSGMILRFDGKDIVCDIGRGQGIMPLEEQVRGEPYTLNKRLTFYILDIRETMRGKQIIVSRSSEKLVAKLFAREVPEVSSGAVEIKKVVRDPGVRSKVAVVSTQPGVDPVGSCVGQKGVRVQAVIDELNGEKIDVIQYNENIESFIAASLSPAEKLTIKIDAKKKIATVSAPEDQLSLAIGREGQNVRLASQLTGYKIDIKGSKTAKDKEKKDVKKATQRTQRKTKSQRSQKLSVAKRVSKTTKAQKVAKKAKTRNQKSTKKTKKSK